MSDCPSCQTAVSLNARFCAECGHELPRKLRRRTTGSLDLAELESDVAGGIDQQRVDLLCRYLPTPLVRHLLTERRAPVGQRGVAAVVFADISGFTAMSEQMDPEAVLRVMNGCFEGLVEAVERYGGVVDKFIGDCLMATFGIPNSHDDDAARAVKACQEMFLYLDQYNRTLDEPLGLSVGVNYGPLVAGNLGSRNRMDYTVMGDVVNLAQRLESAAQSGQILVSESVYRSARQSLAFHELERITVKGKAKPVRVYVAVASSESDAPKTDVEHPMKGREELVETVRATLDTHEPPYVLIDLIGESGVGVTRVALEAARGWAATNDAAIILARAPGFGLTRPYGALGALVEAVCHIEPADAPAQRHHKLQQLAEIGLEESWRLFLTYAAAPSHARVGELDHDALDRGLLGATRALFSRLAGRRFVVVMDGIDQFDVESVDLFKRLWPDRPPSGLLLLSTRTSDVVHCFGKEGQVRPAQVAPLDPNSAMQLALSLIGVTKLPPGVAAYLYETSAGYPRYLIELIASLKETGYITTTRAGTSVRADLIDGERISGLEQLVRTRIDRLSADHKLLLQGGALYGQRFPGDVITTAIGEPRIGGRWLEELVSRGLLERDAALFSFAHGVIHQVALDSMLDQDRARLSAQLGAALEAHADGARDESLPRLARLFGASEDVEKGGYYRERAGDHLLRTREYGPAAAMFEALVDSLEGREATPGAVARAWLRAGRAHELAGHRDRAREAYDAAKAEAEKLGATQLIANAQRGAARVLRHAGDLPAAAWQIESALGAARMSKDAQTICWVLLESAEVDIAGGRTQAAIDTLGELQKTAASLPAGDAEGSVLGRCLGRLGRLKLGLGDVDGAQALLQEGIARCESAGDQRELVRLYGNLGALNQGHRSDEARAQFERAIALARQLGDRLGEAKQLYNLGSCLIAAGDRDSARACFNQALALAAALQWTEGLQFISAGLNQL